MKKIITLFILSIPSFTLNPMGFELTIILDLPEVVITSSKPVFLFNGVDCPDQDYKDVRVDSAALWNDTILLACLLNTELSSGTLYEKGLIAQVVVDRTENNFNNYGKTIKEQIFAPAQFSGVVKRDKYRWCYYFHNFKGRKNNPPTSKKFRYEPNNKKRIFIVRNGQTVETTYAKLYMENYSIAKKALEGKKIVNIDLLYFCNPKISTDSKQVAKVLRNKIELDKKTKHIYAGKLVK